MKLIFYRILGYTIIGLFALLFIIFICSLFLNRQKECTKPNKYYVEAQNTDSLSLKNIYEELLYLKIEHPDVVLQQIYLETGNLTSYNCLYRHNLTGFRRNDRYCNYESWKASIFHYKRWQFRKYNGENYYTFLKNIGYAEDFDYICKLKGIKIDLNKDS